MLVSAAIYDYLSVKAEFQQKNKIQQFLILDFLIKLFYVEILLRRFNNDEQKKLLCNGDFLGSSSCERRIDVFELKSSNFFSVLLYNIDRERRITIAALSFNFSVRIA